MIVGTVRFVANIIYFRSALHRFVKLRMKLKLFPSVAHPAAILKRTTVFIVFGILFAEPDRTLLRQVFVNIWFSSEILPIVSVNALVSGVGLVTKRTPNSFVVEHKKVHVFFHLLKQVYCEFIFMVRERAHISILTAVDSVRVSLTEFGFVLFWVIKVLDSVVTTETGVTLLTLAVFEKVWTQFGNVVGWRPSSICLLTFVVVKALLGVVVNLNTARLSFKCHQVQVKN